MSSNFVEIGSEFWYESIKEQSNPSLWEYLNTENTVFTISGRTAIDYVLKNIKEYRNVKTVYFPSYCCDSMLQPFKDNNISIKFYNVSFENNKLICEIDEKCNCDIFFAMNYFGYSNFRMDKYISIFKSKGSVIIEDITHSLLSDNSYCVESDYVIASLRKWVPVITGGIARINNGTFKLKLENKQNNILISNRKEAMIEKNKYINGCTNISKEFFLKKYKQSNELLAEDYSGYSIDKESIQILKKLNVDDIKKKRKKNVDIIYNNLKQQDIIFLNKQPSKTDCLIFVPILAPKNIIKQLKHYLINNNIYCPSHWPIPSDTCNSIYEEEISLICDQRYTEENIKSYINILNKFHKENFKNG